MDVEPDELRPLLTRPAEGSRGAVHSRPSGDWAQVTVVDTLRRWCGQEPGRTLYTWLDDEGKEQTKWSYLELEQRANAVCHALLHEWGCEQDDRAALMYLPGLEFMAAFWGCLFAGVIAVPVYPVDLRGGKFELGVERFGRIVGDCEAKVVLSHAEYLWHKRLHAVKNMFGSASWPEGLEFEATDGLEPRADCGIDYQPGPEQLAFLQFTSGSTGDPKGVMVSHGNLAVNQEALKCALGGCQSDVACSWLPQYHDAGLIGVQLLIAYSGASCVLMAPMAFIQKPFVWLEAMSKYNATNTCAPNFAYDLCVRKVTAHEKRKLDLSQMTSFANGAEPVTAAVVEAFRHEFSCCGYQLGSMNPTYGMAEYVVFATNRGPDLKEPRILDLDQAAIEEGLVRVSGEASSIGSTGTQVSCGVPGPGIGVKIVDPQMFLEADPDRVGEIWVSGPSKAQGYWGKPELSRDTFQATIQDDPTGTEYLRTGDLGFIHQGELYVCGRLKDLIIVRGKNYYPHDIERTAEASHKLLKPGCSAAFSVEEAGEERLVVVAEVRGEPDEPTRQAVLEALRAAVALGHGLEVQAGLLLKERTVPKTTSGKIKRRACKQGFEKWLTCKSGLEVLASKVGNFSAGAVQEESVFIPTHVTVDITPAHFVNQPALASQWLCETIYNLIERPDLKLEDIKHSTDLHSSPGLRSLEFATLQSQLKVVTGMSIDWNVTTDNYTVDNIMRIVGDAVRENNVCCAVKPAIRAFEISEPYVDTLELPLCLCRMLQVFGMYAVVVMAAVALFLPYYLGQKVRYGSCNFVSYNTDWDSCLWVQDPWSYFYIADDVYAYGLLIPLLIILWTVMICIEVIIIKWVVIGRYKEGTLGMTSCHFVRWWFVDRVFDFWDTWVGYFIWDTALHTLFYKCLGLQIAWGSSPPLAREFDLVYIGASSDCVDGNLYNAVVEHGLVRLRAVQIGDGCKVKKLACVMPGCSLCDHTILEPHAVMLEGSVTTEPRVWKGNPATSDELSIYPDDWSPSTNVVLLVSKPPIMTVLVFGFFYCSTLQTQQFYHEYPLPRDWRYSELIYWSTTFLYGGLMQCISCIILKWALVGRLSPGDYEPTTFQKVRHWIPDFVGTVACFSFLRLMGDEALYPNTWGMMLGSSVSASSRMVCWNRVPPSKADLFKIGSHSFVSVAHYLFEEEKSTHTKTRSLVLIGDGSEVGYRAVLGPDVTVEANASVGLLTWVHHVKIEEGTTYFAGMRLHNNGEPPRDYVKLCPVALIVFFSRLIWIAMLIACLIPAYEFEMLLLYGEAAMGNYTWNGGIERYTALLLVSVSYLIAVICITLLGVLMTFLVMGSVNRLVTEGPLIRFMYVTMLIMCKLIGEYLGSLLNGSVMYVWLYRIMGAQMLANDTYINRATQREYNLLQVSSGCVINQAHGLGHKFVHGQLIFGPNVIGDSTEVQQGAVVWAGSVTGPNATLGPASFQTASTASPTCGADTQSRVLLQGCPAFALDKQQHVMAKPS